MGLPSIAMIASAPAPQGTGGAAASDTASAGDFTSLFRGLAASSRGAHPGSGSSTALAQLESLLGGMLQQPTPAFAATLDRVQSALGAPPQTGTHASVSSIATSIDAALSSGTAPAQIESTVSQALAKAFADLSSSTSSVDAAFVSRLNAAIATTLNGAVVGQLPAPELSGSSPLATMVQDLPAAPGSGPPANGPPANGPPADTAGALAKRIVQIGAAIAAEADTGATGQQFRNLASTLDPSGRGLPAPQTQTAGAVPAAVASPFSGNVNRVASGTLPPASLPQSAGAPVRIDAQLAPVIALLALARNGGNASPHGDVVLQPSTPSGTLLATIAGVQPASAPSGASATTGMGTPSAPIPQGDPYGVIDQVARALSVRSIDGTTALRIHLVPQNLGEVSVRLVVGPNGVSAAFTAATPAAGAALQQGASQLGRALTDHGLQLQQFSVNVGTDGHGGLAYRQPQPFQGPVARYAGAAGSCEEDPLAAMPSFGPPTTARPLGYLDYLA